MYGGSSVDLMRFMPLFLGTIGFEDWKSKSRRLISRLLVARTLLWYHTCSMKYTQYYAVFECLLIWCFQDNSMHLSLTSIDMLYVRLMSFICVRFQTFYHYIHACGVSTMCCVDTIYTIHTEVPADWCSDRVQFPVAPKGLDWLFVCIITIIMWSTDQVILCSIQFCSLLNFVESVPVQWTHQILSEPFMSRFSKFK